MIFLGLTDEEEEAMSELLQREVGKAFIDVEMKRGSKGRLILIFKLDKTRAISPQKIEATIRDTIGRFCRSVGEYDVEFRFNWVVG